MSVDAGVGVFVGERVGVAVGFAVGVSFGAGVGVFAEVAVLVLVEVCVPVGVDVATILVDVGVVVSVGARVGVEADVAGSVGVLVGVEVGVAVASRVTMAALSGVTVTEGSGIGVPGCKISQAASTGNAVRKASPIDTSPGNDLRGLMMRPGVDATRPPLSKHCSMTGCSFSVPSPFTRDRFRLAS